MTFEQLVRRRWRLSIAWLVFGVIVVGIMVVAIMSFVVFVHFESMSWEDKRLILVVTLALVYGAGFIFWAARGNQLVNADTIMRDAGPIERRLIAARVQQEDSEAK